MRALVLILDSVGVGGASDAAEFGDDGADTLGHVLAAQPRLNLPTLLSLGLGAIVSHQREATEPQSSYGRMRERSRGKDTTTGHWEIAGVIVDEPFATFERFPAELVREIERDTGVLFIGNYAQSGTVILDELGAEHVTTGRPILYTSADSVMQIAAHEDVIPPKRLHAICAAARERCDRHRIGRVIARPFNGTPGRWQRTSGRHDYSMVPPPTILNALVEAGHNVIGVGKIADIFAGSGITESQTTSSNDDGMKAIREKWNELSSGLLFANLVDFDTLFGHRRDVAGYGRALEEFDAWLGDFLPQIRAEDLLIITADHGNDPTFRGTDHTREEVPLLVKHRTRRQALGVRETFADVAATLAAFFHLEPWPTGEAVLAFAHAPAVAH